MRKTVLTFAAVMAAATGISCRSHQRSAQYDGPPPAPTPHRGVQQQQERPGIATVPPPRVQPALPAPRWMGPTWYPAGRPISPRWTTIVIHHSATDRGSAAMFDRDHRGRGWDELGYHFVIGNGRGAGDGQIEVGPRWNAQKHGAHCKTPDNYFNEHGIGICLVGDFTRGSPSPRQMAALQQLVSFLSTACNIRPDRVTTHGAITGKTACPGRNFPLQSIRRTLLAKSTPRAR